MAVSALGMASGNAFAVAPSTMRPTLLIVDTRFAQARAIAREYIAAGCELAELPRDVLEFWRHRLQPAIRSTRPVFAGITTERAFFILRTLAADHRLRVHAVAFAAPRAPDEETLMSWVIGPAMQA